MGKIGSEKTLYLYRGCTSVRLSIGVMFHVEHGMGLYRCRILYVYRDHPGSEDRMNMRGAGVLYPPLSETALGQFSERPGKGRIKQQGAIRASLHQPDQGGRV